MFIVYETTNLVNGKYYVGVHKVNGDNKYLGSGKILKKAIAKYGSENFWRVTLQEFSVEQDAYEAETEIVNIDMVKNTNSYNIVVGGGNPPTLRGKDHPHYGKRGKDSQNYGFRHTEEFKEKQRISNTGKNNPMYGKKGKDNPCYGLKRSEETCKKISKATKGIPRSEEYREMRRIVFIGKGNPMYGKKGKDNHCAKLWFLNGKLFYSANKAADFFDVSDATILRWCSADNKHHIPLCYHIKKNNYYKIYHKGVN